MPLTAQSLLPSETLFFYLAPYLDADSVVFSSTVFQIVARKVAVSSEVILGHVSVSSTPFFWIMKNSKKQQETERERRQSICAEEGIHQKNLIKTEIKHVFGAFFLQETFSTFGDPLHEVLCIVLEHSLHVFGSHGDLFGLDQHKPFSGGLGKLSNDTSSAFHTRIRPHA